MLGGRPLPIDMLSPSTFDDCAHIVPEPSGSGLLGILLNPLIFYNVLPYFAVGDILHLAATSRSLRSLIYNTPGSLRHLDLTRIKAAQPLDDELSQSQNWRAQLSDHVTEDHYYSSPLRRILGTLKHQDLLQNVQTLILDGLSVTAELCSEIINNSSYSVRLLSIRDTRNLNHSLLCGALKYACRTSRPEDAPRLKALYVFGSRELPGCPDPAPMSRAHHSLSATLNERSQRQLSSSLRHDGDAWWDKKGRMIGKAVAQEWASCLMACESLIVFDAVLCKGPRHINSTAKLSLPRTEEARVATFALPPCQKCNAAPEGVFDRSSPRHDLPLLSPPPLLSSSVSSAVTPRSRDEVFVARCADCLRERYCISCHSWWCEECYSPFRESEGSSLGRLEGDKAPITKSCWECGINCRACIEATQFACKRCNGGYCIVHNEGSTLEYCDWCVCRGRGRSRNHL